MAGEDVRYDSDGDVCGSVSFVDGLFERFELEIVSGVSSTR